MARRKIVIDESLGLPLVGSGAFGLVDRNTSLVEVKPITGCNLDCVFCSVDEGSSSRKVVDFVVDKDYLAGEFKRLARFKMCMLEAHINAHGEPLLHPQISEIVQELRDSGKVHTISMDTNGVVLNEKFVDELIAAGMSRFNLSINAVDNDVAKRLANVPNYNVEKLLRIAEYIASKDKSRVMVSPVWVPGLNDGEIPKLVEFAKRLGVKTGIQNFLNYEMGRNPARQMPWKDFYSKLGEMEKVFKTRLILSEKDFGIHKTIQLPKPFKKGDLVEAVVVCDGRYPKEKLAVAGKRSITVPGCGKEGTVMLKIVRSKHNIFVGRLA